MAEDGSPGGIQSVERAADVLRAVCGGGGVGVRLVDIAAATGLSSTTTHRMVTALVRAGLLDLDRDGLAIPGLDLLVLGAAAGNRHALSAMADASARRLADRTGDTVYVSLISGTYAWCVDRVEGSFPIATLTLTVGARRPLGVGAGSLAILAALPDDEVSATLDANDGELAKYPGLDRATLLALVDRSRRQGYAVNDGRIIEGMSAVGRAIRLPDGSPIGALSVAAISPRLRGDRLETVVRWLRDEATVVEELLHRQVAQVGAPTVLRLLDRETRTRGRSRSGSETA